MGVPGLNDYINRFGAFVDVTSLRGKTLAIDGHIWLFEAIRGPLAHGKAPNCATTFFQRILTLLNMEIEPIVCFDNVTADFPQPSVPNKLVKRSKRCGGKAWNVQSYSDLSEKIDTLTSLLHSMGIQVIIAKEDGEAQCAQLEQAGLVQGCITVDYDYFLYGGENLYKFDFSKSQPSVSLFSFNRICAAGQGAGMQILNRNRLIAMATLLGNDYFERGIEKIGFVSALEIMAEFSIHIDDHPSTILDRFRSYSTREVPERKYDSDIKVKLRTKFFVDAFPDGFPNTDSYLSCVNIFLLPDVMLYDGKDFKLPNRTNFDKQRLHTILVKGAGWDPSRFEKEVQKCAQHFNYSAGDSTRQRIWTGRRPYSRAAETKAAPHVNGNGSAAVDEETPGCSSEECSRRQWAALLRLRRNYLEYSDMPVSRQNELLEPLEASAANRRKRPATLEASPQKKKAPSSILKPTKNAGDALNRSGNTSDKDLFSQDSLSLRKRGQFTRAMLTSTDDKLATAATGSGGATAGTNEVLNKSDYAIDSANVEM